MPSAALMVGWLAGCTSRIALINERESESKEIRKAEAEAEAAKQKRLTAKQKRRDDKHLP